MKTLASVTLTLLLSAGAALAHHSFDAEFDAKAPVTLQGEVTKLDWLAPHVMIHAEVKDAKGQTKTWELEAASPEDLMKAGWTERMLAKGTKITVHGYRAKGKDSLAAARSITLANGKTMATAPDDGGPKPKV